MELDAAGNIFVGGNFSGGTDFDPGPGTYVLSGLGIPGDGYLFKLDSSGNFVWAKRWGNTAFDMIGSFALDAAGNIYAEGLFQLIVDFDPGSGVFEMDYTNGTLFILKLDNDGNFIFAKQMGGSNYLTCLAIDTSNNIYLTGSFSSSFDADPGAGVYNLTTAGNTDVFIVKLNALGDFTWAKRIGGAGNDYGEVIVLDSQQNLYVSGFVAGNADLDPGPGTSIATGGGLFISKLDNNGEFIYGKSILNGHSDGVGLIFDSADNMYITGMFDYTVDFDPGPAINTLTSTSIINDDSFLLILNPSGDFVSAHQIQANTSNGYRSHKCAVDPQGNIYLVGVFGNNGDFDPGTSVFNMTSAGQQDGFIVKLSATPLATVAQTQQTSDDLIVYPNPTQGQFTLKATSQMHLSLYNELGQRLDEISLNALNNYKYNIDSGFSSGIYFVIGNDENKAIRKKIIVR